MEKALLLNVFEGACLSFVRFVFIFMYFAKNTERERPISSSCEVVRGFVTHLEVDPRAAFYGQTRRKYAAHLQKYARAWEQTPSGVIYSSARLLCASYPHSALVSKEEREMKSREQGEEKIASDLFKTRLSLRIEKGLSCGKTRWADKSIEQEFALWMIQIFDRLDWVLCLFTGNQEALLQLLKAHTLTFFDTWSNWDKTYAISRFQNK